jgi:hypothetical protein
VIYSVKELNSIFLEHKEIYRFLSVETIVHGVVVSSAAEHPVRAWLVFGPHTRDRLPCSRKSMRTGRANCTAYCKATTTSSPIAGQAALLQVRESKTVKEAA